MAASRADKGLRASGCSQVAMAEHCGSWQPFAGAVLQLAMAAGFTDRLDFVLSLDRPRHEVRPLAWTVALPVLQLSSAVRCCCCSYDSLAA